MKILRTAALAGVAKKLYDESRKPHNQAKIRAAMDKAQAKRRPRAH
jgi:tRNA G18 (ribose-2'-O)-methylase SpoU